MSRYVIIVYESRLVVVVIVFVVADGFSNSSRSL